jgi:hypothetical protein
LLYIGQEIEHDLPAALHHPQRRVVFPSLMCPDHKGLYGGGDGLFDLAFSPLQVDPYGRL